jgi:hypothetical protein
VTIVRQAFGYLLLGIPLAILLFIGLLGLGRSGIFAGVGFFGAIWVTLKFLSIVFIVPMLLGAVLAFVPDR